MGRPGRTSRAPCKQSWVRLGRTRPHALGELAPLHNRAARVLTPRTTAPSRTEPNRPRRARRGRRHGRARGAFMMDQRRKHLPPWAYEPPALGVRTSRPGRTNLPPWAYEPPALGVRTARPGRTNRSPWAQSGCALRVLAARRGRTHRAQQSHSAGPHPPNAAPSKTKRRTQERRNRHQGRQGHARENSVQHRRLKDPRKSEGQAEAGDVPDAVELELM